MQISDLTIDDFKTPRKDLMPPLPLLYRLVPIVFYLSLVFLAVVGSLAMWHKRVETMRYLEMVRQKKAVTEEIATTKAARAALEEGYRESASLYDWVESSMPLQPMIIAILKSMKDGSKIVDLSLERDAESPSQLRLALTVNTDSEDQIQETLKVIREKMNYLEFSPTQSKSKGNIEYRALLVRNKTGRQYQTPQQRRESVANP